MHWAQPFPGRKKHHISPVYFPVSWVAECCPRVLCPAERKSREENKLLHKTKTILFGTYVMIYPILSSEQEIVCLQLFQAFKIPLYSLCSQLNEDHLGQTREMMSFGLFPPFPFLTGGYSLPQAAQNPCTIRVKAWFP